MKFSSIWIFACRTIFLLFMVISRLTALGSVKNSTSQPLQNFCRVSGGLTLNVEVFSAYSCATCYLHMDSRLFENGTKLEWRGTYLMNPVTQEKYEASYTNTSSFIFRTFRTPKLKNMWIRCCQAAEKCCEEMRRTPPSANPNHCPRTWDGWNCWKDTDSSETVQNACPPYIYFHSDEPHCTRFASKQCLENGTWYFNERGKEYSDYTSCGQGEEIKMLLNTHIIAFSISIVLLLPALGIFFFYRQLRVHRIFMHKNLFISLLFTAIFVITFESYYLMDSINNPNSTIESNTAGCKVFYAATKYFRLSTYTWMFCEGFYLHKLIAAAFAEQKSTILFHVIGWCLPVLPVGIWAIVRKVKADESCWTVPAGHFEWIMFSPMLLALVVNFCFLSHIIQVIITKLRSTHVDEPTQFRRAVRATMVLIPLFGLHFLFLSYHPRVNDCYWQKIYDIVTYLLDGLQGGIVSLIFCYFNNEVLFLLRRTYNRRQMVRSVTSSRRTRESRTSVSTNAESFVNDNSTLGNSMVKK